MKLIIEDDEGRKTVVPFVREEITIGRQEKGNTIRLTERNVSRRHAKLLRANGTIFIEDLGSFNGTRVNGEKIAGKRQVREGDLIEIGDYDLAVQGMAEEAGAEPTATGSPTAPIAPAAKAESPGDAVTRPVARPANGAAPVPVAPSGNGAKREPTAVIRVADMAAEAAARPVQEIPPEQTPRLVCTSTEHGGREFVVDKTVIRMGRTDEDNEIAVDHRSVSRNHAKLARGEDGLWSVIDLQSANGVRVNGEAYGVAPLRYGDTLELGHVKFRFVAPGEKFVYTPEPAESASPSGPQKSGGLGKLPLVIGASALVLVGGLGLAWKLDAFKGSEKTDRPGIDTRIARPEPVKAEPALPKPEPRPEPPKPEPAPPDKVAKPEGPAPVPPTPPTPVENGGEEVKVDFPTPGKAEPAGPKAGRPAPDPAQDRTHLGSIKEHIRSKRFVEAREETKLLANKKLQGDMTKAIADGQRREIEAIFGAGQKALRAGTFENALAHASQIDAYEPGNPRAAQLRSEVAKAQSKEARSVEPVETGKPEKKGEKVAKAEPTTVKLAGKKEGEGEEGPAPAPPAAPKGGDKRKRAEELYREGFTANTRADWTGCIDLMRQSLKADPSFALAERGLGVCYAKVSDDKKAYCHYKRYLELDPGAPESGRLGAWIKDMEETHGAIDCKR